MYLALGFGMLIMRLYPCYHILSRSKVGGPGIICIDYQFVSNDYSTCLWQVIAITAEMWEGKQMHSCSTITSLIPIIHTGGRWVSLLQVSHQGPHPLWARNGSTYCAGYHHSLCILGGGSHSGHSARCEL